MGIYKRVVLALGVVLAIGYSGAVAADILGRVTRVLDGDTIEVLDATNSPHRIRFAQIDAPEKNQAFGQRSKQSLSDLVFGKQVNVVVETTDQYHRTVGTVFVGSLNTNLEQVKRGMAWVYRQYARDTAFFAAEEKAKAAKIGLWADPNPEPPWNFRRSEKSGNTERGGATLGSMLGFSAGKPTGCGAKHRCSEMVSCEEAKFYLHTCGISSLDGNGDGVPCAKLCK